MHFTNFRIITYLGLGFTVKLPISTFGIDELFDKNKKGDKIR